MTLSPLDVGIFLVYFAVVIALGYYATRTLLAQMDALRDSRNELHGKVTALTRREQELSLLTERVTAMIAHFDRDRVCRFANSAYARFYGRTPEDLLGRPAQEIIGTSAYADVAPGIERVLAGQPVRQNVTRIDTKGDTRTLALDMVPDINPLGGADGWYALIRDITDGERAGKALRHIIEGTASATGTAFFRALTLNLAQATGLGRAMVAEILPDGRHARALAYWAGEEFRQGMVYLLEDAPCREVIAHGEACFLDGVAELFPHDLALAMNGIRGYYGARLESAGKAPLGVLVVMDGSPIRNRAEIASLVKIFAARAAAELERLRAEAKLQRSSERFSKVFAASPSPIVISSLADGRYADVNPAFERTFGWTRDEVVAHSALDIGIWPSAEERARWIAELESARRTQDFETVMLTREGEPLSVLLTAEAIDLDGVPHLIAFAYDQTQHRRAEDAKRTALERFEAIFQNTPNVAIQGYDARHRLLHWNRASETMYGLMARDAIGLNTRDLLGHSLETAAKLEAAIDAVFSSGLPAEPAEWCIPFPDGREIWVLSTLFPVFSDGVAVEVFFMDIDITDMKRSAEAVGRLNVELEARVAARTAELAALNRELEVFSYSVSHDLRAPLRSIEGFGRLLEQEYAGQLDATGLGYVNRMGRAARRLAQLIDDLLDLTRIDRTEIRPADLDLSAMALEIVEELRQGAPQRQASVAISPGLRARGDAQLIRIALQNLLDNAWKYTGRMANARIEFGNSERAGERVFHVRDNGAGFDMAYAAKLFAPFQRLHSPHDFEGTGVGLASVARVIKRHGGRIWAEAAPAQGATFYFTLG